MTKTEKTGGKKVAVSVIRRLPRYYRYLSDLIAAGRTRISSRELASLMGLTDSQIRQDLNTFGGFGQQGYGYNIEPLFLAIKRILGANADNRAIIVGCGNLGTALAMNMNFARRGVSLIGLFDNDPARIGKEIRGLTVSDVSEIETFCREQMPEIAVLTLPRGATAEMAERLVRCGIKGLWNFSNTELRIEGACVENVHLGDSLMMLSYALRVREETGDPRKESEIHAESDRSQDPGAE